MALPNLSKSTSTLLASGFSLALIAALIPAVPRPGFAQDAKKAPVAQASSMGSTTGGDVARGKYIVEDVAMCGTCHTPRRSDGQLDRSRWLMGASVPYLPAQPTSDWPINAPRLAGTPPATNAQMITLLTTAIWTNGAPLRDPMPKFHMTRSDAEAVVAYLRSLSPGQ
jgi:mono/diheme cytochrome c family protein